MELEFMHLVSMVHENCKSSLLLFEKTMLTIKGFCMNATCCIVAR